MSNPDVPPKPKAAASEEEPLEEVDVEFSIYSVHDEPAAPSVAPASEEKKPHGKAPESPLAGRYQLTDFLGRGAMGEVWKARDLELSQDVAVKILKQGLGGAEIVERFWREARVLTRIRHPNVLEFRDYGGEPRPYLVMELLHGRDLRTLIARQKRLPLARAAEIFKQACAGLAHVHEAGVIHRDIKPANIFCVDDGPVKLVDFGLAKRQHALARGVGETSEDSTVEMFNTRAGMLLGTIKYMSPEQMSSDPVDYRTDLWSMAIVLFKMLTGKDAFDGETEIDLMLAVVKQPQPVPSREVKDLPPKLDNFFLRALQKNAAHRFGSATEMAEALSMITDEAARKSALGAPR